MGGAVGCGMHALLRAAAAACLIVAWKPAPPPAPPSAASAPALAAAPSADAAPSANAEQAGSGAPAFRGEIDPRFVADLQKVYADYKGWGRVDDELRFAPWLCRMPEPGMARISAADHGAHGRKLYSLFAREHGAYLRLGRETAAPEKPVLQAVVKESYFPEDAGANPVPRHAWQRAAQNGPLGEGDHFWPYARGEGGKVVKAGAVAGLFVVLERPAGTPGTDDGFVYGTMTPTGEITSAGKVGPCMGCHEKAKHRRLFGTRPAF